MAQDEVGLVPLVKALEVLDPPRSKTEKKNSVSYF